MAEFIAGMMFAALVATCSYGYMSLRSEIRDRQAENRIKDRRGRLVLVVRVYEVEGERMVLTMAGPRGKYHLGHALYAAAASLGGRGPGVRRGIGAGYGGGAGGDLQRAEGVQAMMVRCDGKNNFEVHEDAVLGLVSDGAYQELPEPAEPPVGG